MGKDYHYQMEQINVVNGKRKKLLDYTSRERLKEGNVYLRLQGLPVGAYRVLREINGDG